MGFGTQHPPDPRAQAGVIQDHNLATAQHVQKLPCTVKAVIGQTPRYMTFDQSILSEVNSPPPGPALRDPPRLRSGQAVKFSLTS